MPAGKAGFTRDLRLLTAEDFSRVFQKPRKSADACFTILWRDNSCESARLGLAISKKSARRAVDRNRIKRLVRESFRLAREQLPDVDIVVMSRPGVAGRSNRDLCDSLQKHWKRLILNG